MENEDSSTSDFEILEDHSFASDDQKVKKAISVPIDNDFNALETALNDKIPAVSSEIVHHLPNNLLDSRSQIVNSESNMNPAAMNLSSSNKEFNRLSSSKYLASSSWESDLNHAFSSSLLGVTRSDKNEKMLLESSQSYSVQTDKQKTKSYPELEGYDLIALASSQKCDCSGLCDYVYGDNSDFCRLLETDEQIVPDALLNQQDMPQYPVKNLSVFKSDVSQSSHTDSQKTIDKHEVVSADIEDKDMKIYALESFMKSEEEKMKKMKNAGGSPTDNFKETRLVPEVKPEVPKENGGIIGIKERPTAPDSLRDNIMGKNDTEGCKLNNNIRTRVARSSPPPESDYGSSATESGGFMPKLIQSIGRRSIKCTLPIQATSHDHDRNVSKYLSSGHSTPSNDLLQFSRHPFTDASVMKRRDSSGNDAVSQHNYSGIHPIERQRGRSADATACNTATKVYQTFQNSTRSSVLADTLPVSTECFIDLAEFEHKSNTLPNVITDESSYQCSFSKRYDPGYMQQQILKDSVNTPMKRNVDEDLSLEHHGLHMSVLGTISNSKNSNQCDLLPAFPDTGLKTPGDFTQTQGIRILSSRQHEEQIGSFGHLITNSMPQSTVGDTECNAKSYENATAAVNSRLSIWRGDRNAAFKRVLAHTKVPYSYDVTTNPVATTNALLLSQIDFSKNAPEHQANIQRRFSFEDETQKTFFSRKRNRNPGFVSARMVNEGSQRNATANSTAPALTQTCSKWTVTNVSEDKVNLQRNLNVEKKRKTEDSSGCVVTNETEDWLNEYELDDFWGSLCESSSEPKDSKEEILNTQEIQDIDTLETFQRVDI